MERTKISSWMVLESDGQEGVRYGVSEVRGFTDGLVLVYEKNGKKERVYVGRKYRPLRIGERFWVGKNVGNNSAAGLVQVEGEPVREADAVVGPSTDSDCPGEDLSRLVACDILGIGMKAIKKRSVFLYVAIIIGIVVVIAMVLYFRSHYG